MSGALKKIAETTVTSNVASVTLTGIDTTYNVYNISMCTTCYDAVQIRNEIYC